MGRVKLKIKRLENNSGRQVTYSKRRSGILKKAREISILCDIDIALLMFSPTGKPTVCLGEKSSMEEVVGKFAQLTAQERAKRKLESLEALKKTFKKLDHDVNIQDFLGSSNQTAEDLSSHSRLLQARLSELRQRLSCWTDAEKITNVEHLKAMEESLQESLSRMRAHKENAQKQQQHAMALACFNQFDEGMNLPMGINVEQEARQMPWLPCNDPRQPLLPDNLDALSQSMSREIDCTPDSSIPSYSGYFGAEKQSDLNQQEHMVSIREFNPNGCMNLQVGEFSFNPYDPSSLGDKKLLSDPNVGFLDDSMNYRINSYDMPRPGFIDSINEWTSSSAPYPSFPVYNELSYPHIPNQG